MARNASSYRRIADHDKPSPSSFRADAKHRTRNLEILRCAIAHHSSRFARPGMTVGERTFRPGMQLGILERAGDSSVSLLHCSSEAATCVRSHISPGPYRSFRELSLAGPVGPDIWCPPTFVGNSGIECFNGVRGFALFPSGSCLSNCVPDTLAVQLKLGVMPRAGGASSTPRRRGSSTDVSGILDHPLQCAIAHKAGDDSRRAA